MSSKQKISAAFTVTVSGVESVEQAKKVMTERLDHDEDYGFPYSIGWGDEVTIDSLWTGPEDQS